MSLRSIARGPLHAWMVGALAAALLSTPTARASAQQRDSAAAIDPAPAAIPPILAAPTRASRLAPLATFSASAQALRDSIVAVTRAQVGLRYVLGGQSPDRGFDCSGLVKYVMDALRIDLPRTANQQAYAGRAVERDTARLRPGDLLTFGRGKRVTHIGIYVGNGRFVHASTKVGRVIESPLLRPPARGIKPWRGARTLVAAADEPQMSAADGPQTAADRRR